MSQRNARLIGGIYRTGQIITAGRVLTIYTAYNRNTSDVVGLFVLELPPTLQLASAQQFLQPLEQRRSLQSHHVLRVHDWGLDGQRVYIVTDPLRGVTLQHILDTENVDIPRALDLSRQITLGLKACHEHGIAGLDLRPQLITVDTIGVTDRVQIDDIGLRSLLNTLGYISDQQTEDIGYFDPRYSPPEYIKQGQIGPWSDLYQLGLLLFTMVTGRLPFVGRNHAETGVMQSNNPVPRMSQYNHDTPAQLQEIAERLLAKQPAGRFSSVLALLAALDALQPSSHATVVAQDIKPAQPSMGLTREILPLKDDTIQRSALADTPTQPPQLLIEAIASTEDTPAETDAYAYLCYEQEDKILQRIAIMQKVVVVGRIDPKRGLSPDIDLSALDPTMTISSQHARIRFEETFFYIEDLKSRNKTRLGELVLVPLKAELLQHGDTIRFGSVALRFEIAGKGKLPASKGPS